jgi:hypothetical protein
MFILHSGLLTMPVLLITKEAGRSRLGAVACIFASRPQIKGLITIKDKEFGRVESLSTKRERNRNRKTMAKKKVQTRRKRKKKSPTLVLGVTKKKKKKGMLELFGPQKCEGKIGEK